MSRRLVRSARTLLCGLLVSLLPSRSVSAQAPSVVGSPSPDPYYFNPFPAFKLADQLYYVGTEGLATYLLTTPQGHILINSGFDVTVPRIRESVRALGFRLEDIKILLSSHAHGDHVAGSALMQALTGAQFLVMDADVPLIQSGGAQDFQYGADLAMRFPVARVDRVLHDGDTVRLGNLAIVAHKTAGHTPGTTTWTWRATDRGRVVDVLVLGSVNVNPGYRLVANQAYPTIADDYARMFETLRSLPCELFLGAHGSYFGLPAKYKRWVAGDSAAFVDPAGCRQYLDQKEAAFRAELQAQRNPPRRD